MYITAHRGNSDVAPENTLSAIQLAIQEQADYAEIDVQQTKDGKLVVLHDSSLKRVAGVNRKIWEMSYEEVRELDVGSWFSSKFAKEKLPTLEEVIKLARGKIKLNIEVKVHEHKQDLAQGVVQLVQEQNFTDQCIITSFDYETILQVKELDATIPRGIILKEPKDNVFDLQVDLYSIHFSRASRKFIETAHALEKEIHVWTVNNRLEMKALIKGGVDSIITNKPKLLRQVLSNVSKT